MPAGPLGAAVSACHRSTVAGARHGRPPAAWLSLRYWQRQQRLQRRQLRISRHDRLQVGDETRCISNIMRLAITVGDAGKNAQHLQVALYTHEFDIAFEGGKVCSHGNALCSW